MENFKDLLLLDEITFKDKMAEIDSICLISFLKNCNDGKIKNKFYKKINNILGKNYLKILKLSVNDNEKSRNKIIIMKYILILLNIIFSSLICIQIYLSFLKIPLYFFIVELESFDHFLFGLRFILGMLIAGFVFSVLPQIILYNVIKLFYKYIQKKIIVIIIDIVMIILLGLITSKVFVFFTHLNNYKIIKEFIFMAYPIYLSIIISGIIFRIILFIINKKCIT
jgi:hypothetical protein